MGLKFNWATGKLDYVASTAADLSGLVPTTRQVNGHALSADVTVTKSDVGLGNADNISDANKPVSTAQQTALDLKAPLASPIFTGNPTGPNPTGDTSIINRGYVVSRGQNLVTNGSGLLGSNYNFRYDYYGNAGFTFDPVETHGGGGSFFKNAAYGIVLTEEYLPVDVTRTYRSVAWGQSGEAGGTNYNAANLQAVGVAPYDIDDLLVEPPYYSKYPGATDTTIAVQLNPGDTTLTLTDATGWNNTATLGYERSFVWWPYVNSKGYSYPIYTYTRNAAMNLDLNDIYYNGLWAAGGITGNVITLRNPWAGPTLPVGTPVRNHSNGGTLKYITMNGAVPNAWTRYEGYIGGIDTGGTQDLNKFPYGTVYVKPIFLNNFHGVADNNVRWSDVWFSELAAQNLVTSPTTVADTSGATVGQLETSVNDLKAALRALNLIG